VLSLWVGRPTDTQGAEAFVSTHAISSDAAICSAHLLTGYNKTILADAVELFLDVPWSTRLVEQGHGSLAVMHRLHPSLGCEQLLVRGELHQARALFSEMTEDDAALHRAATRLHAAEMKLKRTSAITGRNMFFQDFHAELKAMHSEAKPKDIAMEAWGKTCKT